MKFNIPKAWSLEKAKEELADQQPDTGDLDALKKKLVAEREAHETERYHNASKIHTLESKVRELTDRLAVSIESEASLRRKLAEARLKLDEHNRPYEG